MTCPDCGYIMTAFDKDCPRCLRYGSRQLATAKVQGRPPQVQDYCCDGMEQQPKPEQQQQERYGQYPKPGQSGLVCRECKASLLINTIICPGCGVLFNEATPPWTSLGEATPQQQSVAATRLYHKQYDRVPKGHNRECLPGDYWWPAPSSKASRGSAGLMSGYVCGLCCTPLGVGFTSCPECAARFSQPISLHPLQAR